MCGFVSLCPCPYLQAEGHMARNPHKGLGNDYYTPLGVYIFLGNDFWGLLKWHFIGFLWHIKRLVFFFTRNK